jgi:large subunit ribosomal protein L5
MRFNELYQKKVRPALKKEFSYKSDLAIPKITKVSLNVGVGRFAKDKAYIDGVVTPSLVFLVKNQF